MFVKVEVDWNYIQSNSWSGARDVVREVEAQGRALEALCVIETYIGETLPTETELNDFIWFELADLMNLYGDRKEE
jgi:hypothetical protein|nr:MAG TPA: hypothetical protein [Caudoviricetes sp.]